MRRMIPLLLLVVLVLAGCGGPPPDTTVPTPPQATPIEETGSAQIDRVLQGWREAVPEQMRNQGVQDPIEEQVYQTNASLQEIADYYDQLVERGWVRAARMPGLQEEQGVLLLGYELGNADLVVGALDASQYGGSGRVIYTATGSR